MVAGVEDVQPGVLDLGENEINWIWDFISIWDLFVAGFIWIHLGYLCMIFQYAAEFLDLGYLRVAQGLPTQCLAATGAPVRPVPLCQPNSLPCAGCQEVPPTGADHHQIRTAAEIQPRRCCLALGGWKIPFSTQGARGALRRAPSTGAHFPNSSCSSPDRGHDSTNAMPNPILSFRMYRCFLGFTHWCSVWSRAGGFPCVEARLRQLGIRREMISDGSHYFIYRLTAE
jgi:hypothetical protein